MRIHVGSKNGPKIKAVQDTVLLYPNLFKNPEVVEVEVEIDLFGHPKSIDETTRGAIERAKQAFTKNCDYSFGLEGGLIAVPGSKTGFMETNMCAIYDGKQIHLGMGPSFEWPKEVAKLILKGELDASAAMKQLGYTQHEKIGAQPGGTVGYISKGRLSREEQVRQSIVAAMIHLENPEWY